MMTLDDRNIDILRSQQANAIKPFTCCQCAQDSEYGKDGLWYCSDHWQTLEQDASWQ